MKNHLWVYRAVLKPERLNGTMMPPVEFVGPLSAVVKAIEDNEPNFTAYTIRLELHSVQPSEG